MNLGKHVVLAGTIPQLLLWGWCLIPGCATDSRFTPDIAIDASSRHDGIPLGPGTAPLRRHEGMLFAPATVNGTYVGLFLLDTGSTLDVIGQGVAARLKLPTTGQSVATGIGGPEDFVFRRARSMQFGDIVYGDTDLASLYLNRFQKSFGVSINGILGFRSLSRFPFTIDYQARRLTLHDPAGFEAPADANRIPICFVNGLPAVEVYLTGARRAIMILDTGADNHVTLPHHLMVEHPEILAVPQTGMGRSIGIGGTAEDLKTWLGNLRLFNLTLNHVPVTFTAAPTGKATPGVAIGRLGSALLQSFQITVDVRARAAWVLFRPHDGSPP